MQSNELIDQIDELLNDLDWYSDGTISDHNSYDQLFEFATQVAELVIEYHQQEDAQEAKHGN